MTNQDPYLLEVFPKPPLTAFKKQNNIRNILIKSKLPNPTKVYPTRNIKGMSKCARACTACPYINEVKNIKINNESIWKINNKFNCESYNIIYLIECNKETCRERYIGQSKRNLVSR